MTKQKKLAAVSVLVIVTALVAAVLAYIYAPSNEVMELTEYFKLTDNEMAVVMQDRYSEEKGICLDGVPYISFDMAKNNFNNNNLTNIHPTVDVKNFIL